MTNPEKKTMWRQKRAISATKAQWRVILAAMAHREMSIESA
jgi:hypothetical protein